MNLVIDASVAAKWILVEEGTSAAKAVLQECKAGRWTPLAPEILPAEIAAVLWKRVIRGLLEARQATFLYARFEELRPILVPLAGLVGPALQLALRYRHSLYDGLYVALSHQMNCRLVTADEELHRRFRPDQHDIMLLRDWRSG
ncbi:MAG: type II toxin-antitoxin system VapC family toxin [Terriglobia bacterium]